MGHAITAIVLGGDYERERALRFDLRPVSLAPSLTMFHVDHYFTAYWQAFRGAKDELDIPSEFPALFPREGVVREMVCEMTGKHEPTFAIVMTDYFGGVGDQWACVFRGATRTTGAQASVNEALRSLGVVRTDGLDEFDTVGLGAHRSSPEYLERYIALCEQLGV